MFDLKNSAPKYYNSQVEPGTYFLNLPKCQDIQK